MKITKHEHACLVATVADENLVIDPGSFLAAPEFDDVVAIVVTHEHPDHFSTDHVERLLERNPAAKLYGPAGAAQAAPGLDVTVVAPGDRVEAGPFTLRFFGGTHNVIHESIPLVDNVGVLVNDELYHPGDSYAVPDAQVGTLAAPIGGPWLKIGEAMDFVLAVKPKRAFYMHDVPLSQVGKQLAAPRLKWAAEQRGGTFAELQPGESIDV